MKFPGHKETLVSELCGQLKKMYHGWVDSSVITIHFKTAGLTSKPLSTGTPGHFGCMWFLWNSHPCWLLFPSDICPSTPNKSLTQPGINLRTHSPYSLCFFLLTLGSNSSSWFPENMSRLWEIFLRISQDWPSSCVVLHCLTGPTSQLCLESPPFWPQKDAH